METPFPFNWLIWAARSVVRATPWATRQLAGVPRLERRVDDLVTHVGAMTDVMLWVTADLSDKWELRDKKAVLDSVARFRDIDEGLGKLKPSGNPLTAQELNRLREYTDRAKRGDEFTREEAVDFRALSDLVASEHPDEPWVVELLKVALFIFALYALSRVLKPKEQ